MAFAGGAAAATGKTVFGRKDLPSEPKLEPKIEHRLEVLGLFKRQVYCFGSTRFGIVTGTTEWEGTATKNPAELQNEAEQHVGQKLPFLWDKFTVLVGHNLPAHWETAKQILVEKRNTRPRTVRPPMGFGKGWRNESARHGLAAKGIKTGRKR